MRRHLYFGRETQTMVLTEVSSCLSRVACIAAAHRDLSKFVYDELHAHGIALEYNRLLVCRDTRECFPACVSCPPSLGVRGTNLPLILTHPSLPLPSYLSLYCLLLLLAPFRLCVNQVLYSQYARGSAGVCVCVCACVCVCVCVCVCGVCFRQPQFSPENA